MLHEKGAQAEVGLFAVRLDIDQLSECLSGEFELSSPSGDLAQQP